MKKLLTLTLALVSFGFFGSSEATAVEVSSTNAATAAADCHQNTTEQML